MNNVKIGAVDVPMLVNAATDAYYEKVFGESSILIQSGAELSSGETVNLIYKMGFIMAQQAVKGDFGLMHLTRKNYFKWLSQFSRADYIDAIWKIRLVYEGLTDKQIEDYQLVDEGE